MQDKENIWYLDSRVNNHICGDKNNFMELNEAIRGNANFMNHLKVAIKGKCIILIKLKDISHQFTGDVYYIQRWKTTY